MACYHFRIKSDKKSNGMRISSLQHVMYVNREGRFKNVDAEQELYGARRTFKNLITGERAILSMPKQEMLLYSSPFGRIKLDKNGIRLSADASRETCAIALKAAQKIFGDELELSGDASFQEKVLSANATLSFGAHFCDINLELENEKRVRECEELERYDRISEGRPRPFEQGIVYRNASGRSFEPRRRTGVSSRFSNRGNPKYLSDCLRGSDERESNLSGRSGTVSRTSSVEGKHLRFMRSRAVDVEGKRTRVLLPHDEHVQLLERARSIARPFMRRSLSRRREQITETANEILKNMQNSIGNDFAYAHLEYINREAAYQNRGGCKMTGHHLPRWAEGSAMRFFHAADRYERKNGERYKEIVFSLPNELPLEQSKEILDRFLEAHLKKHYYAWAIHEKVGAMSIGERHPHVHIMFSTRENDILENVPLFDEKRQKTGEHWERPPKQYFSRYNAENPVFGGAKKAEKWRGKYRAQYLLKLREDYARFTNEVLKKYDVKSKVSHLSLKAQRLEAEQRGDYVLAEILNRVPEQGMNPTAIVQDDIVVKGQKEIRKLGDSQLDEILSRELRQVAKKEKKSEKAFANLQKRHDALMAENFNDAVFYAERESLEDMRKKLDHDFRLLEVSHSLSNGSAYAIEKAFLDVADKEGQCAWEKLQNAYSYVRELRDFRTLLYSPEDATEEDVDALDEFSYAMEKRIEDAGKLVKEASLALRPHLEKMKARSLHKAMQMRIQHHLFDTEFERQSYVHDLAAWEKDIQKFEKHLDKVRTSHALQGYAVQLREDLSLTLQEVSSILSSVKQSTDQKLYRKAAELRAAKKEVLSYDRIMKIAESNYFGARLKKFNEREHELTKKETYFEQDQEAYYEYNKAYHKKKALDPSFAQSAEGIAMEKKIQEMVRDVFGRALPLALEREEVDKEREAIAEIRDTEAACYAIANVAFGILRSNRSKVERVKKLSEEYYALEKASQCNEARRDAVREMSRDGRGRKLRIKPMPTRSAGGMENASPETYMDTALAIADNIERGNYTALVAKDKNDREIGNWQLLSEFEKEEIRDQHSIMR